MHPNILIIGGGIAGLTSAIHLSRAGFNVTLFEKNEYPRHKVCGEYVSNEVLPYLEWLEANPANQYTIPSITQLAFSTASGKKITAPLPLGGFGISRFLLDDFLYKIAVQNGCNVMQTQVTEITFKDKNFTVKTTEDEIFNAPVVLGAFGKRSNLDIAFKRGFIDKKSPWLAVKQHYNGSFPDDVVGLHCFQGGYCGVSKIEDGLINICYLTDYPTFKRYKDIEEHRQKILYKNPVLKEIFEGSKPVFEKPLTISQISFEQKESVEQHVLMIGDTAGLINPLCGNGMAMAIHSAKIASEVVIAFLKSEISRVEMEKRYTKEWNALFKNRMQMGTFIAGLLHKKNIMPFATTAFSIFPSLLKTIIHKTHGQPIKVNTIHEYNL